MIETNINEIKKKFMELTLNNLNKELYYTYVNDIFKNLFTADICKHININDLNLHKLSYIYYVFTQILITIKNSLDITKYHNEIKEKIINVIDLFKSFFLVNTS